MSHQPYEFYLFSSNNLTEDQQKDLTNHLLSCEQCNTLANKLYFVDELLHQSEAPQPPAAFTARWEQRLASYHTGIQKRNHRLIALGLVVSLVIVVSFLGLLFINQYDYAYSFSQFIARFSLFIATSRKISTKLFSSQNNLVFLLPSLILFAITFIYGAFTVTIGWFYSFFKLTLLAFQKE